jgi:hypothetical protein
VNSIGRCNTFSSSRSATPYTDHLTPTERVQHRPSTLTAPRCSRAFSHYNLGGESGERGPARAAQSGGNTPRDRPGIKAVQADYSVQFDTATNWINRFTTAHATGRLEHGLQRLRRYKLLIIDEVGYLPFDHDSANLFFQLGATRYEQGAILVVSNMPFGRWGEIFSGDIVAAVMIDRLVHHTEVITLNGHSYRTRSRRKLLVRVTPVDLS